MTKLSKDVSNKAIPSEHAEQVFLVSLFRRLYPDTRIIAIPNGGARNPATAAMLKAEGVTAGVPDLFIPEWRLWIELKKRKGGVVSPQQRDWIEYLNNCGYKAKVCHGADEAMSFVDASRRDEARTGERIEAQNGDTPR